MLSSALQRSLSQLAGAQQEPGIARHRVSSAPLPAHRVLRREQHPESEPLLQLSLRFWLMQDQSSSSQNGFSATLLRECCSFKPQIKFLMKLHNCCTQM